MTNSTQTKLNFDNFLSAVIRNDFITKTQLRNQFDLTDKEINKNIEKIRNANFIIVYNEKLETYTYGGF